MAGAVAGLEVASAALHRVNMQVEVVAPPAAALEALQEAPAAAYPPSPMPAALVGA